MYIAPYQITDETTLSGGESINVTDVFNGVKKIGYISFNWTAGTAPTTAENIVITLDSGQGAGYDVTLRTVDPSTFGGGFHKWIWNPHDTLGDFTLADGDHIKVTYTNTDDLAIGVVISLEVD
jgi:hypothetical protein